MGWCSAPRMPSRPIRRCAGTRYRSTPPQQFSRPVEAGGETRDAVFRTTRLPRSASPAGRLYFCQHLTRDLVWRDEWRHHANGAVGVARAVIAAEEPEVLGGLFARMFGSHTRSRPPMTAAR